MPDPDMVFTQAEVDASDRAHGVAPRGRHHRPTGPDMVFTPSDVASASAPAPDMVFTAEEVDAYDRAHGTGATAASSPVTPERQAAVASAGASRQGEIVGAGGAVNDVLSATNAYRSTSEIRAPGIRGPFLPRSAPPVGSPPGVDLRPPEVRVGAPMSDRVLGPISAIAGLGQMYNAWTSGTRAGATDEDRTQAAFGMGTGALGAAGGVATTAGMSNLSGALGVAGGALESAQGIRNLGSNDVAVQGQGGQQLLHGVLSGGAGIATLAGSTVAAPLLTAGAAGVSIGTTMQQRADAVSLEQGRYTEQRAGRGVNGGTTTHNISATDAAVRGGMEDGELTRQALMDLTGNQTISNAAGYASGFINTGVRSIYNTLTNLW